MTVEISPIPFVRKEKGSAAPPNLFPLPEMFPALFVLRDAPRRGGKRPVQMGAGPVLTDSSEKTGRKRHPREDALK
ncbi:MAG: hypothetical protein C6P37_15305 [Caldibacillus debilis]|uniref:Uncharacterized protein n=1 Tax=Caldibacillus debilis TaxID=301148 RepID=A0A3E0JY21_9BACI|nr:hypothetical protein [Bacillaceae bacterium]REJ25155.1 MAG: hypothetical protein C6P37_15305 [Caldibacillus debilis]